MRTFTFIGLTLAVAANLLRADFTAPFADSPVGSTVTSSGVIIVAKNPTHDTSYSVRFRTDTGPKTLPATIPAEMIQQETSKQATRITATIREREDPKTKAKVRYLEVIKLETSK